MLPNNPQQYGQPSRHGSIPANPDSLHTPNPISDHLWSIFNPQNCRSTWQKRSLFIEIEDNPLLKQDLDHDQNLDSIWNLL